MMKHKELFDEVYENRLESANTYSLVEDEGRQALKDVAVLTDRQIELEKLELEKRKADLEERKADLEERKADLEEKKQKFEPIKVIAVPVGMFLLESLFMVGYVRAINNFEKEGSYITTPGKAIGDMFRKKLIRK